MASCRFHWSWIVNSLIVFSLLLLIVVSHLNIVAFPKMGFYCGDPSISYKFNGDTVSLTVLFATSLIPPLLLMGVVEYILARSARGFKNAGKWYGQFVFGLLLLIFLIEASKSIVSEPRPHFIDTCRPDRAINCTAKEYISDYKCSNLNTTPSRIRDSVRSFPSGHAAMGFYTSLFIIAFLQARAAGVTTLFVPWMQCLVLLWAVFCALSRIIDRRHHWWDVAVGSIVGICSAVYVVTQLCQYFRWSDSREDVSDSIISRKECSTRRLLTSTSSYSPSEDKHTRPAS